MKEYVLVLENSYHGGSVRLQFSVGIDFVARNAQPQYTIGHDNGLRVRVSMVNGGNTQVLAVLSHNEWWRLVDIVGYATHASASEMGKFEYAADYASVLGEMSADIATTIAINGSIGYGLGRQAACEILARYRKEALPAFIADGVDRYTGAVHSIRQRLERDPHNMLLLVRWGKMSIFFAPFVHGNGTNKRWRLKLDSHPKIALADAEIVEMFAAVNRVADQMYRNEIEKDTKGVSQCK